MAHKRSPGIPRDRVKKICSRWHEAMFDLEQKSRRASAIEMEARRSTGDAARSARSRLVTATRVLDRAYERVGQITESVFEMPAVTYAGVAAKLQVIVTCCDPSGLMTEEPWPWLRDVQFDLDRLIKEDADRRK